MTMESHSVRPQQAAVPGAQGREDWRGEGGVESKGRCWCVDKPDWTEPGQNSREQGREVGLLTDITAVKDGSGAVWWAGPGSAHLSLPFWMEAWPRLALSKSGEFLLRFVLVERTLFCRE